METDEYIAHLGNLETVEYNYEYNLTLSAREEGDSSQQELY
jgi:hypothetical protein